MKRWIHEYHLRRREGEGKRGTPVVETALSFLSGLYGVALDIRNIGYDKEWIPVRWIPAMTISVGGIVAGGVGKTPAVALLAETLLEMGRSPLILIRGYGAPSALGEPVLVDTAVSSIWERVGDEAFLLARRVPKAVVVAYPDRYRAALWASEKISYDTVLLDDGFQHRRLGRDLDLVSLDASHPQGMGHLLPRGDLREDPKSLSRAQGLLLSRASEEIEQPLIDALPKLPPVMRTRWKLESTIHLRGRRIGLIAGIARPHRFLKDLESAGLVVAWSWFLPDHEPLTREDVEKIKHAQNEHSLDAVVMTGKDGVRWAPLLKELPSVHVIQGSAEWFDTGDRNTFIKLFHTALESFESRNK